MHSNLHTVSLFHFKPHTGNYSLLSPGVNVFVAPPPPLTLVVLFPGFFQRMGYKVKIDFNYQHMLQMLLWW